MKTTDAAGRDVPGAPTPSEAPEPPAEAAAGTESQVDAKKGRPTPEFPVVDVTTKGELPGAFK